MKSAEKQREDMLRIHEQSIRKLETRHANLMKAVEDGDFSAPIVAQLNKVDAELIEARAKRAALTPEPITLPTDLPALYRAYVEDIVTTLQDEEVSGRASEELHSLVDTVSVDWDADEKVHYLELRGKLLEIINAARPAGEAGLAESESSLKLVAGVGFEPTTFRL
jgi:site-specific DNA recombinase